MEKTPYQEAVEKFGKETIDKVSRRAVCPETGYIAWHLNELGVTTFPSPVRCCRCGGYGMWEVPRNHQVLCLKCLDEWMECGSGYRRKHGWRDMRSSSKKWMAAFNEFCQTKPKSISIEAHNREIESGDRVIHAMFPQYYKQRSEAER